MEEANEVIALIQTLVPHVSKEETNPNEAQTFVFKALTSYPKKHVGHDHVEGTVNLILRFFQNFV